jgi:hypothetical protein
MAYTTTALVKAYLGISGNGDDTLIGNLIARAQAVIDASTNRTFEADTNTTRYFAVGVDTDGRYLYLDEDLCSINTVTTNADNASPDTLTQNTDYIVIPRNETPYHTLKILGSSVYTWTYSDDPEMGVEISGKWAYSTTAPDDIVHACTRLTAFLYRQKESNADIDRAITTADGGMILPTRLPADIKQILSRYTKIV